MNKTKRACSLAMSFVLLLTMLGAAQLGVFAAYVSDTPISSYDVTADSRIDGFGDCYGKMSGWAIGTHSVTAAKKSDGLGGHKDYYMHISQSGNSVKGYIDIVPGSVATGSWAAQPYDLSSDTLVFDFSLYIPEGNGAGQIQLRPTYATKKVDDTTSAETYTAVGLPNYIMFGLKADDQHKNTNICNSGEWNRITCVVRNKMDFEAYVNGVSVQCVNGSSDATYADANYLQALHIYMAKGTYADDVNPTGEFCFDDLKIYKNPNGTPDTAPEAEMVSNDTTQKVAVVDNTDSEVYISGTTTVESLKDALEGEGYTAVPITESKDGKETITKVAYWKDGCAVPRYYKVLPGDYFKVVGMVTSNPKTTNYKAMKATVKIGLDCSEAPVLLIGEYSTVERSKLARTTNISIESKGRVEEFFEVANVYMRTAFLFKSLESLQPLCAKLYF